MLNWLKFGRRRDLGTALFRGAGLLIQVYRNYRPLFRGTRWTLFYLEWQTNKLVLPWEIGSLTLGGTPVLSSPRAMESSYNLKVPPAQISGRFSLVGSAEWGIRLVLTANLTYSSKSLGANTRSLKMQSLGRFYLPIQYPYEWPLLMGLLVVSR